MRCCIVLILAGWAASLSAANTNVFELVEGDRVVFVGDTLVEREARYGHLEFALTTHFPDRHITFRNLGWSADLPNGRSRVSFDWSKPDEEWFQGLLSQIRSAQPTVVLLGYGMAASFEGEAGLESFKAWMTRLVDGIRESHPKARWVFMTPIRHELLPAPLPDPGPHNEQLALYSKAIVDLADRYEAHLIRFFEKLNDEQLPASGFTLTDNGIHLNDYGYRRAAEVMEQEFGWVPADWQFSMNRDGSPREGSYGTTPLELERYEDRARLVLRDDYLARPPWLATTNVPIFATPTCRLQIRELPEGDYDLKVDGRVLVRTNALRLSRGAQRITAGPQFDQAERLRQTIVRKNEWFFHRWRPQNSTYLFLFRKHEQGQNAREIPEFDPLIEAEEQRIAELRRPVPHTYELVPAQGDFPAVERERMPRPVPAAERFAVTDVPAQALPEFELDPNLEIALWAENPLLAKPIQINFDSRGRLWVVNSSVYPQIKPGQQANDTVLILEDSDQDGHAETSKVFAEGLLIPTGVEPGDGGAYVGHSTELLHLRDVNGDDRADETRVVLSGFGTEDTHHILHTLRWGYDGRLYMNQSIYIHTHTETPLGVVRLNSGGILGLRPGTMELEVFMKGLVNSWGHHFDLYGQSFATDGAGTPESGLSGISYVVPGAMYHTYAGARRILGSVSPGSYPKFCGLEYLQSPHFPEAWQGQLVTCDFRAHRVVRFALRDKDSAYTASEEPLFIRSANVTFRPIDVKIGPDGALYIADWSNPIIQHGEVDFRDPRRDHVHGRIWRVTHKGRPLDKAPAFAQTSYLQLFDLLVSPNGNARKQARRELVERGPDFALPLQLWLNRQTNSRARLEALWLFQSVGKVMPDLLAELLRDEDGRVRAAAVRVLSDWHDQLDQPLSMLADRVNDPHPRVRLEALRALSHIPSEEAASLALSVLRHPMDTHLDYALWLTINDLAKPWLRSLESGEWPVEGREDELVFGLNAVEPTQSTRLIDQFTEGRSFPRDGGGSWVNLILKAGGPKPLARLWRQILEGGFEPEAASRVLAGMHQAARSRQVRPEGALDEGLTALLEGSSEKVRVEAVRVAGAWKMANAHLAALLELARSEATSAELRRAVFETLRDTGGPAVQSGLVPLTEAGMPMAIRSQAVLVVMALDGPKAAAMAVQVLSDVREEEEALSLWRNLLRIKGAARDLTSALPATGISATLAKTGLRAAREGGRQEPELILALSRGADLDSLAEELTQSEMQQLAERVQGEGDPARGEGVYRRVELACVTCHGIGGVGGKVGPDLTSIGASAPVDYLIESLLYPNRKIKEGYHSVVLETKDDEEFSGILVRETGEEILMRDALNREMTVPKIKIARRTMGHSLMPSGLMDALPLQDRLDLLKFLSVLGKPGSFDATRGTVARVWWLRPDTIDLAQFGEEQVVQGDWKSEEWTPAYSWVDGRLSQPELQAALNRKSWRDPKAVYAAARFEVPEEGEYHVRIEAAPGAAVWMDGKALSLAEAKAKLAPGAHTLIVKLSAAALPEFLRAQIEGATFLAE